MVRACHKYAFNPSKIRFYPNTKLPTDATGKSEKRFALIFLSPGPTPDKPSRSSVHFFSSRLDRSDPPASAALNLPSVFFIDLGWYDGVGVRLIASGGRILPGGRRCGHIRGRGRLRVGGAARPWWLGQK
jgi:hypothetical protein